MNPQVSPHNCPHSGPTGAAADDPPPIRRTELNASEPTTLARVQKPLHALGFCAMALDELGQGQPPSLPPADGCPLLPSLDRVPAAGATGSSAEVNSE
jgi:hypothetical protein